MELLYVWIEDYKNIHHQGFNFSPEFHFIFNPENWELTVERKEDSNLFKDYCINLTAIIGKNGSSKTTLLEFLLQIALEDENDEIYMSIPRILGDVFFIILFDTLEKKFVIAGKDDIKILDDKIKNNYIPKQFSEIRKQINTMYYSPFFTGNLLIEKKENAQDISVNNYGKINSYKIDEVTNQIAFCLDNNELVEKYVSTPHILEIIISINDNNYQEKEETSDESYYEKIKNKINKFYNENNFITLFLAKQKEKIKNSWEDLSQVEISKDDVLFLIAFDTLNDFIKKKFDPSHEELFYKITSDNYQELEDRIFWIFNLGENKNSAIQKYDLINDFCSSFIQYGEQDKKYKDNLIYSILEDIKKLKGYIDSISNAKYIYRKGTITIGIDILENKSIKDFVIFTKNNKLSNSFNYFWHNLSSGELTFLNLFSSLYNNKPKFSSSLNILLIDEGEVGMHPDWQIKYIYILLNFIKKLDIKCQIILTSHSPFIISDIPKENIIFLDKYNSEDESIKHSLQKKGNCKVVRDEELIGIEKTFGQNIHTLFTSSYFLKDGLMGEFAKGKINKIIDFYKKVKTLDKENPQFQKEKEALKEKYTSKKNENGTVKDSKQDKFRKIQKMIGEDYLAEIIKNHLEELDWILLGEMPINNRIESLLKKEGLTENKISEILKQIEEGKPSDKN